MHPESRVIRTREFSGVICANFDRWWLAAAPLCGKTTEDEFDQYLWIPTDEQIIDAEAAIKKYLTSIWRVGLLQSVLFRAFLSGMPRQYLGIIKAGQSERRIWVTLCFCSQESWAQWCHRYEKAEEFTDTPYGFWLSMFPGGYRLQYNVEGGRCHSLANAWGGS